MTHNLFEKPFAADRRLFIKGVGVVTAGLLAAVTLGGCDKIFERIRNRPVRRRLRTGSPEVDQDIAIYKDAVAAMRALDSDPSNPRSWAAQAAIHGSVAGGFNLCQHGTDHFFSWHRAYLLYFEQICRELTGEDNWGLPYWNWNLDPTMHPDFTAAGSVLNHPRNNTSVAGDPAFSDALLGPMMGDPDFFTFSSQIEGTPHSTAHIIIGQNMGGGGSARDPIFWAHHCMVDYCWAKWNLELGHDSPADSGWQSTSWDHFTKGDGTSAGDVTALATVLMPLLSYRYEASDIGGIDSAGPRPLGEEPAADAEPSDAEFKELEDRLRRGADIRTEVVEQVEVSRGVTMRLDQPLTLRVPMPAATVAQSLDVTTSGERSFLRINHADLPETNDFLVRAFIGLPQANGSTPTDDPHFAGTFAFFGTAAQHEGHEGKSGKTEFLVDVSNTVERLTRENMIDANAPLSVQLVAVPPPNQRFARPDSNLTISEIALIKARVLIDAETPPG
jgi:tyrosinase